MLCYVICIYSLSLYEYLIEGYKTIFHLRASKNDKIRTVALVSNEVSKNIKVKKEVMSEDFPSIWLEMSASNSNPICVAGFYRQWSHKGDKTKRLTSVLIIPSG